MTLTALAIRAVVMSQPSHHSAVGPGMAPGPSPMDRRCENQQHVRWFYGAGKTIIWYHLARRFVGPFVHHRCGSAFQGWKKITPAHSLRGSPGSRSDRSEMGGHGIHKSALTTVVAQKMRKIKHGVGIEASGYIGPRSTCGARSSEVLQSAMLLQQSMDR